MAPLARMLRALALPLSLLASGCGAGGGARLVGDGGDDGGTSSDLAGQPLPDGGKPADMAQGPPGTCDNIVGDRKQQVCLHWTCGRADRSEGAFNGNIAGCMAGTVDAVARKNTLAVLNAYRFLADLPPVNDDPVRGQKAQACSLMMDANNALSHMPPMNWKCYSADGAAAAGSSNISSAAAVLSIDMYMKDFGNEGTIGHRRWILSNSLGPVGVGSAPGGSCLWVIGGSGSAGKQWTAFPSPGPFPIQAVDPGGFGANVDKVGWSVQSDSIDVSKAQVSVTRDGQAVAVASFPLPGGYGSQFALRFTPTGWVSEAGHTYHVKLSGVQPAIEYDVEVVSCP